MLTKTNSEIISQDFLDNSVSTGNREGKAAEEPEEGVYKPVLPSPVFITASTWKPSSALQIPSRMWSWMSWGSWG
jgi:hypothetical protein